MEQNISVIDVFCGAGGLSLGLKKQAEFNVPAYTDCFVAENLIRKYIKHKGIDASVARTEIKEMRKRAKDAADAANISVAIRSSKDIDFLDMKHLAEVVEGKQAKANTKRASLARDAIDYKPMRDAVAHTNLLTDEGKKRLENAHRNIKARINKLLKKP